MAMIRDHSFLLFNGIVQTSVTVLVDDYFYFPVKIQVKRFLTKLPILCNRLTVLLICKTTLQDK